MTCSTKCVALIRLDKSQSVPEALQAIQAAFPRVRDFERDFPSLCFNVATGVGKTRLMGAFITYLYKAHGLRHFFILAPNLTIYNKLIGDFSPGSPKYVLQGLAEFATNPPEVITGDNYESGKGNPGRGARPEAPRPGKRTRSHQHLQHQQNQLGRYGAGMFLVSSGSASTSARATSNTSQALTISSS